MSCVICNFTIENTHTASAPCCAAVFHTACFVSHMPIAWTSTTVGLACPVCYVVIRSSCQPYVATADPDPVEPVLPEYVASVRRLRKAVAVQRKAAAAFQPVRVSAQKAFKAQTAPLIASLKAMKREALIALKLTPEFRATVSAQRQTTVLINHIKNSFSLSSYLMERFGLYRSLWKTRQKWKIRRAFRIRL